MDGWGSADTVIALGTGVVGLAAFVLVELHVEVDSEPSSPDRLVLRGRGVLDRRGVDTARPASTLTPQIQLDLAVRARPVQDRTRN